MRISGARRRGVGGAQIERRRRLGARPDREVEACRRQPGDDGGIRQRRRVEHARPIGRVAGDRGGRGAIETITKAA